MALRHSPSVTAVVLSMGNRPAELTAALQSLRAQRDVELQIVLVGVDWDPTGHLGVDDRIIVKQTTNLGIPGGRNFGAAGSSARYLLFFDDDAVLPSDDIVAGLCAIADRDPDVALVQPRGADPDGRSTPRRWVPRLRTTAEDPTTLGGEVAVFWEAVSLMRRTAFEEVGGWPGAFWYGHEGVDLAWRLIDAGWKLIYAPQFVVHHPATTPTRHTVYYRMNARNRVWVARRNLPAPLLLGYLAVWTVAMVLRLRSLAPLRTWFSGFIEGWRTDPGPRHPMRWRSVAKLFRLGRPPLW